MKGLTEIKVRGYHLDVFSHVNNARYLEFLEEARWSVLEESGFMEYMFESDIAFIVVNINIDYKSPATVGDILEIVTTEDQIGKKSMSLNQKIIIKNKEKVSIDSTVTFVLVDNKTGKSIEITDDLKNMILR